MKLFSKIAFIALGLLGLAGCVTNPPVENMSEKPVIKTSFALINAYEREGYFWICSKPDICARSGHVDQKKPPQILIDKGIEFGVDFSNAIFASQSLCSSDTDLKYKFDLICSQPLNPHMSIFWVENELSLQSFIQIKVSSDAKQQSRGGYKNTEKQSILFQKTENGISYHRVIVGDAFDVAQASFFVTTNKEVKYGLKLAIIVRGSNFEDVKAKAEKAKAALVPL